MSLPPLASVAALETRLGKSLSGAALARAEAALGDASALVRGISGRDWVDTDGTTITAPAEAVLVTVTAALREVRNPEGFVSETLGDYNYRRPEQSNMGVYLTKDERRMVRYAAKKIAYTVRTPSAFYDARTDPDEWPVSEGGES
jgi:hypothetical protein